MEKGKWKEEMMQLYFIKPNGKYKNKNLNETLKENNTVRNIWKNKNYTVNKLNIWACFSQTNKKIQNRIKFNKGHKANNSL